MKKETEIGLVEIAFLGDCHRQTAYWACRSGEIAGAHQTLGRIWVAPRREVMQWVRRRKRGKLARRDGTVLLKRGGNAWKFHRAIEEAKQRRLKGESPTPEDLALIQHLNRVIAVIEGRA